jgi:hypothetical protein
MIPWLACWTLSCSSNDGALPDLKEHSEISPPSQAARVGDSPPPHDPNEPDPEDNSP